MADGRPRTALRWDYAPAPESRDAASLEAALRPVHRRRVRRARPTARACRRSTRPPRSRSPRSRSPGRRTSPRAVEAARGAARRAGRALPPLERGKYLFRIARLIQERARELAVVESLDGGKPIRESRDVDVPLGRRALLLLRGLGRQAAATRSAAARSRRAASSARSCRGTSRC